MLEALRLAVRAAALTDGAVDPALAGRLAALGYDRDWAQLSAVGHTEPFVRPSSPVRARRRPSWHSIELFDEPPAVRLAVGMALDLGATAKALAADRAAEAAHAATGAGVLLGLGGDIATGGDGPADGWLVRVTDDHRDTDDCCRTDAHDHLGRTGHLEPRRAAVVSPRARRAPRP